MAYTAPTTRSTGNLITATIWNTDVVDNIIYLNSKVNAQIQIPAGAWLPAVTGGASSSSFETTTNTRNYRTLDFSNSGGVLKAYFSLQMPSDYNGGTITYHVNWTCQDASTNSAYFGLTGISHANGEALDSVSGTPQYVTDANTGNEYLNISDESSALTIYTTPAAGEVVDWLFWRDSGNVADDLAATVRVLSVVLTYTRS